MNSQDGALVRLGQAAAKIQQNAQGRKSKELLMFNISLDTAQGLRAIHLTDIETLILGVAGELETNLSRKGDKAYFEKWTPDLFKNRCLDFAEQFVKEIWVGILQQRPPSQTAKRLLSSVYRMSFVQEQMRKEK